MSDRKLFSKGFSTNRIPVILPSTGQNIVLRETTITELKSICMTIIDNLGRRQMDVIYNAMTEYLQAMILTDGIDVNELTEYDRLYCFMVFFQMSFFKEPSSFKCPNCGTDIVYRYDMSKYLVKMEHDFVEDQEVEIQDKSRIFKFVIGWPKVRTVQQLMTFFYTTLGQVTEEMERTQYGIHYIMAFIKSIEVINAFSGEAEQELIDFDETFNTFQERMDMINEFPSKVVFDEEKGLFTYITGMFINRLENNFGFEICPQCHQETNYGLSQSSYFYSLFYGSLKGIYGFIKQVECLLVYRYDSFIFEAEQYITYNELNSLVQQIGTTAEKENQERKKIGNDHLYKGLWMIREILNTLIFPQDKKH